MPMLGNLTLRITSPENGLSNLSVSKSHLGSLLDVQSQPPPPKMQVQMHRGDSTLLRAS